MWIVCGIAGLLLVAGNAVVTVRLWRSPMFDRGQKAAQMAMLWLLPGTALVTSGLLRDPLEKPRSGGDPTLSVPSINGDIYNYSGHSHGGDGGGHGGH